MWRSKTKTEVEIYIAEHCHEMTLREMANMLGITYSLLCRYANDIGYLDKFTNASKQSPKPKRQKRHWKRCTKCIVDFSTLSVNPTKKRKPGRPRKNQELQPALKRLSKTKQKEVKPPHREIVVVSEVIHVPVEHFDSAELFNIDSEENWLI